MKLYKLENLRTCFDKSVDSHLRNHNETTQVSHLNIPSHTLTILIAKRTHTWHIMSGPLLKQLFTPPPKILILPFPASFRNCELVQFDSSVDIIISLIDLGYVCSISERNVLIPRHCSPRMKNDSRHFVDAKVRRNDFLFSENEKKLRWEWALWYNKMVFYYYYIL